MLSVMDSSCFANIVENANDVIVVTRATPTFGVGPEIVYVNQAFTDLTGYSADEVIGQTPRLLQGPGTSKETTARIRIALERGEPIRTEILNYTKTGTEYWIDLNIVPLRNGDGELTHFVAIERDLTAQKRLQADRDRFFELSLDMLCIAGLDGYFKQLNPAWRAKLGYSLDELMQRPFVDFVHPDDRQRTIQETECLANGGVTAQFENRYLAKDGSYHWLLWSATSVPEENVIYAVAHDITERKNVEQAMRESEQRFRSVIAAMAEGVVVQDQDGFITSCNDSAERVLGLTREQIMGRTSVDPRWYAVREDGSLFPGEEHPSMQTLRTGRACSNVIMGINKPDDTQTWISINTQPLFRGPSTEPYAVVATFHDISERLKLDQIKNDFISTVSHELRTPLTSIRGGLGLLRGGALGEMPGPAQELLEISSRNCDRLLHLINDLLDMEKIASGKLQFELETIALEDLIVTALETNKPYGDRYGVTFAIQSLDPGLSIEGDRQRLLQVLTNLLSNAAKFSPAGNLVFLSGHATDDGRVRINVADQGTGIPQEFRANIFGKFAQAESAPNRDKGGTGLGLAITKALVERHGGEIGFHDNEPGGTVFYFELPLSSASVSAPSASLGGR